MNYTLSFETQRDRKTQKEFEVAVVRNAHGHWVDQGRFVSREYAERWFATEYGGRQ